jgi:hypothetical protein
MNKTFNQYCKYLKHLLEVECAEKELDFDKHFIAYINPQKAKKAKKQQDLEEAEKKRLEEEKRIREEALKKELEEKQRKDAERQRQIEETLAEQQRREEEARKKKEEFEKKKQVEPKKRGDLEFEDGYYIGQTQNGLMHGYGTRYWDHDNKRWEGDWVEGEACGNMVVTFGDFVVFEGNMEHGLPNGQGVYTDRNSGQRYEGNFVDFMRDGEGILYTEDGDKIYDGEWKNNKYNGYGQYFLRGQCRYEGNWENGKRNGDGIAYDQNGAEEYNGLWKDDVRVNDIDRIKVASEG